MDITVEHVSLEDNVVNIITIPVEEVDYDTIELLREELRKIGIKAIVTTLKLEIGRMNIKELVDLKNAIDEILLDKK